MWIIVEQNPEVVFAVGGGDEHLPTIVLLHCDLGSVIHQISKTILRLAALGSDKCHDQ